MRKVSPDTTHWIVNNERAAWRDESRKSDAMSADGTFETSRLHRTMSEFKGKAENICSY